MKRLEELEKLRSEQAERNQKTIHPKVLVFARQMRALFGPGVTLKRGLDWPGGEQRQMMRIRIDPADQAFSRAIRERSNWTCQHCHKSFERGAQNLHASHYFSRRHNATRYSPENVWAHCFTCHNRLGGDPHTFTTWVTSMIGPARLERLRIRANMILKLTKQDRAYIANHYRKELQRLQVLRAGGESGYIKVEDWGI